MDLLDQKLDQILRDSLQTYYAAIEHSLHLNLILLPPFHHIHAQPHSDHAHFDVDPLSSSSGLPPGPTPELDLDPALRSSQTPNDASFAKSDTPQQPSSSPSELSSPHLPLMHTSLSHTSSSSDTTHRPSPATSPHDTPACLNKSIHPAREKHSWPRSQRTASAGIIRSSLTKPRSSNSSASVSPAYCPRTTYTPPLRHAPYPSRSPHRRPTFDRPISLPPHPPRDAPSASRLAR